MFHSVRVERSALVERLRDTVVEARSAIADARKLLASDAPLQQDMRASLQELGVAEAEMVQASRLPNPGFSFGRLTQGSSVEIDLKAEGGIERSVGKARRVVDLRSK